MSEQHTTTPIPWSKDEYFNEITVRDSNNDYVFSVRLTLSPEKKRDNVDRILKAVNNHDRLIEALEELANTPIDGSGSHFEIWNKAAQLLTELKK